MAFGNWAKVWPSSFARSITVSVNPMYVILLRFHRETEEVVATPEDDHDILWLRLVLLDELDETLSLDTSFRAVAENIIPDNNARLQQKFIKFTAADLNLRAESLRPAGCSERDLDVAPDVSQRLRACYTQGVTHK